jgi:hypothetical protein
MVEDSPFVKEAMRLASVFAQQRAVRACANIRGTNKSATTQATLDLRVAKAQDALRNHLIKGEKQ